MKGASIACGKLNNSARPDRDVELWEGAESKVSCMCVPCGCLRGNIPGLSVCLLDQLVSVSALDWRGYCFVRANICLFRIYYEP
jgi:hypothetical protein